MKRLYAAIMGMILAAATPATAQEIWFEPHAPGLGYQGPEDWRAFLAPDAPWQTVASGIKIFEESEGYYISASDEEILKLATNLANHGASLIYGVNGVAQVPGEGCGGMEGYGTPERAAVIARRLKRLGISVPWIDVDGPFWFGHYDKGPQACQLPVEEVAHRVARVLHEVVAIFPDIRIQDVEPVPDVTSQPDWEEAYTTFRRVLEADLGKPISMVSTDVAWPVASWPYHVARWYEYARAHGLLFAIIYNGDGTDDSDAAWTDQARRKFEIVEGEMGLRPDAAVFASWNVRPRFLLPETSASSHTGLVRSYLKSVTRLAALPSDRQLRGQVIGAAGEGIAGATVRLDILGADPARVPEVRGVSGIVPPNAVAAVLTFGINKPCMCPADNDVLAGDFTYRETAPSGTEHVLSLPQFIASLRNPHPPGLQRAEVVRVEGQRLVRLTVNAGQQFGYAWPRFPVHAGQPFTLSGPIASLNGRDMSGWMDVVWFDATGKDFWRTPWRVRYSAATHASTSTDEKGFFVFDRPPSVPSGMVRFSVAETDTRRAISATVQLR